MTSPERFHRVQELFDAVLNLPPADRQAFLNDRCFQDESLRQEVESLLAEDARHSGFVQTGFGVDPPSAPALMLAKGTRLGPYEISEIVGAGGMGEVYRARDTKLRRDVALKVLPASFANDPERISRFQREAQMLASLNHPHIAAIYGLEESSRMVALVMELVEGPTLAERITSGPVALEEALGIAKQIADALEAAHERGIVHRDLKPANVKITPEGVVKVLDFGLGKVLNADSSVRGSLTATRAGVILGTAAYMSPEQARGEAVDKRADIWAFGVVLYEMLTGRRPFAGDTIADVLASVVKDQPDLSALPPHTSSALTAVVTRCLSKEPRNRWGSMGDVQWALDALTAGPDSPAPARRIVAVENPAACTEVVEMPQRSSVSRWSRGVWLAAVAVLAAFTGGMWIGHRAGQTPALAPVVRFMIPPPPGAVFEPGTGRQSFQLSPNGRFLAFTARGPGDRRPLWIRDLAQAESRELPAGAEVFSAWDTKVTSLFWSPDSNQIYYTAWGGSLRKISLNGGPKDLLSHLQPGLLGAWFYRGEIRSADRQNGWAVPIAGGAVRKLPIPQPWAQPLPNDDRVIYVAWDNAKDINQVRLAPPDQPGETLFESDSRVFLTPSSRNPEKYWLLYMRGGNLVARGFDPRAGRLTSEGPFPVASHVPYFRSAGSVEASVAGGTLVWLDHPDRAQLVWVDRQGHELSSVGPVLGRFNKLRLSADGRWAAMPVFDQNHGTLDLWTMEIATGTARRVSTLPATAESPVFSPDARRIVYGKAYGRGPALSMLSLQEDVVPEDLPEGFLDFPTDWSPDGRFIAEMSIPRTSSRPNFDVYLIDLARKSELVPLLVGPRDEWGAVFAPDGRSIAFIAEDSGHQEVYVQAFDPEARRLTGTRHQISRGGAIVVRWPKPGRELFYLGADYWIYAATLTGEPKRLFAVPQQAVSMLHAAFGFDVAPGGERFLLPAYRGERPLSLAVVLNWENLVGSSSSATAATR